MYAQEQMIIISSTHSSRSFTCLKEDIHHQAGVHGINIAGNSTHINWAALKHGIIFYRHSHYAGLRDCSCGILVLGQLGIQNLALLVVWSGFRRCVIYTTLRDRCLSASCFLHRICLVHCSTVGFPVTDGRWRVGYAKAMSGTMSEGRWHEGKDQLVEGNGNGNGKEYTWDRKELALRS